MKIRCDRMLRMKGSAEHSRYTCVYRPSRSVDEQLHNNAPHKECLRKKTTACVSPFVFFTIRCGTFPYSIEDDAASVQQAKHQPHITTPDCAWCLFKCQEEVLYLQTLNAFA